MAEIDVKVLDANNFRVTVKAFSTTEHDVHVTADYANKLCHSKMTTSELVKKSFVFLLEREPNTSILRKFDLGVISRYFPEYENAITRE